LVGLVPISWTLYGLIDGFLYISDSWSDKNYLGSVELGNAYIDEEKLGYTTEIVHYSIIGIVNVLPCLTLVSLNASLVIFAVKKANSDINSLNLLAVVSVTTAFLISIIPYFLYAMPMIETTQAYDEIAWAICFLSSSINPFIYLAVNPTFRTFTATKLLGWRTQG
jgi:hypothetical protein